MTKFELVQMFGELEFFGGCHDSYIEDEVEEYGYYTQRFCWNGIGCEIDFEEKDYPLELDDNGEVSELNSDKVKEVVADYILKKIGKAIEVQLLK